MENLKEKYLIFEFASGFLSTQTSDIPGNAGMLDVLLALKWTKKYIEFFNGNNDKITVFGQSSGAVMVSALLISPLTPTNLFHQAICQSASVLVPWAYSVDPINNAKDIATRVNPALSNATLTEINKAFMKMNIYDLLKATDAQYVRNNYSSLVLHLWISLIQTESHSSVSNIFFLFSSSCYF